MSRLPAQKKDIYGLRAIGAGVVRDITGCLELGCNRRECAYCGHLAIGHSWAGFICSMQGIGVRISVTTAASIMVTVILVPDLWVGVGWTTHSPTIKLSATSMRA